jgi:lipoprotein-anchoring transpeptidase ErfK/SrfK
MIKPRYLFPLILVIGLGLSLKSAAQQAQTTSETSELILNPSIPPSAVETESNPINGEDSTVINQVEGEVAAVKARLVLKLKERKVHIYQGDTIIASYPVAVGKKGWETPKGNFEVIQLIKNPIWQNPWNNNIVPAGPKNPLGERWIGFWTDGKNQIGFHGTAAEHLLGQAVSHGCVRMRNKDIKEMFEKVEMGTPVIVEN